MDSKSKEAKGDQFGLYIGHGISKLRLPLREFRLLCEIAKWGSNGQWCDSTVSQFTKACRISRRNIKPTIESLKARGLIDVDRRRIATGKNWQNLYRYTPPVVPQRTLPKEGGSAPSASGSAPVDTHQVPTQSPSLIIYNAYPRKKSRGAALKAIGKALKNEGFDFLLERTKSFAAEHTRKAEKDREFTPYPATWFNSEGYHDEPDTKPAKSEPLKF